VRPFLLPDLGEGLREAEVVAWHVEAGDVVSADDPLVTVETDKAVTEVPSPWSGRLLRCCAVVGERVPVGAALVEFDLDPLGPVRMGPPQTTVEPAPLTALETPTRTAGPRPPAMPAVRELARELGVDLAALHGSGPGGTILTRDVAAAFRGFEPLGGTRRAMAEAMARSAAAVVPATVMDEARFAGEDVTVRLVRALCTAAHAEPALNAWFDADAGRRLHATVDVGLAVDAPHGLVVPVIRDAGRRGESDLRAEIDRLAAAVRERTITAGELAGATITLSNFGSVGGRFATPVVTPPQVAILGAGRIRDALLPLSLTYDHRAATGGEAARFLQALIRDLERED
jgi:pyruvate dehydrogenase E2 component (dihydrolipoamide acetyltransferase)